MLPCRLFQGFRRGLDVLPVMHLCNQDTFVIVMGVVIVVIIAALYAGHHPLSQTFQQRVNTFLRQATHIKDSSHAVSQKVLVMSSLPPALVIQEITLVSYQEYLTGIQRKTR